MIEYVEKFPEKWNDTERKWPGNPRLRAWCKEMMKRYRIGSLKPEQKRKLDALNFPFTKKVSHNEKFTKQAKYYLQFKRLYPNKKVNSFTEFPKGNRLGRWCVYVRNREKKSFSRDQLKILEKVGFDWRQDDIQWRKKFDTVVKFYRQYSRLPKAAYDTPKKEQSLGSWLKYQKKKIQRKKLTYDKYQLLKPYINGVEYVGFSTPTMSKSELKN